MSDTTHDDLVKRLRYLGDHASFEPHMHHTAADRIEELEAKLAMAVEAIEQWANHDGEHGYDTVVQNLLCTLAAIKEKTDDVVY